MRTVPVRLFSLNEAAKMVGVERGTLRRWMRSGQLEAWAWCENGRRTVWLFRREDIEAAAAAWVRKREPLPQGGPGSRPVRQSVVA